MYTTTILTAAVLGFTWGYQPLNDQQTEYIVQLRQHELKVLADGTHEIISEVPPEAGPIGQIRILVGNEELPHIMLPPKPLHRPGQPAQPATALNSNRERGLLDWQDNNTTEFGDTAANQGILPNTYQPQAYPGSSTNRYRSLGNLWTSVVPPIRPEPADDAALDTRWVPPLAQPYRVPMASQEDRMGEPFTPYRADNSIAAPIYTTPQQGSTALDNQTLRFPQDTINQNAFGQHDHVGSTRNDASVADRHGLVGVPPLAERGQGLGFSESDHVTPPSEPSNPSQPPEQANSSGPRWDWSQLAGNPASDNNAGESEQQASGSDLNSASGNSPSIMEKNMRGSGSDKSPWRTWTLLLGPISIALAGLNVYQWGIYKSVRRRYLTLLRRTGEV